MDVKIKLLTDTARVPTYATDGSAAFDIYADEDGVVLPGECTTFSTGLIVEVPDNHVLKIYSRSGHGFKNGNREGDAGDTTTNGNGWDWTISTISIGDGGNGTPRVANETRPRNVAFSAMLKF